MMKEKQADSPCLLQWTVCAYHNDPPRKLHKWEDDLGHKSQIKWIIDWSYAKHDLQYPRVPNRIMPRIDGFIGSVIFLWLWGVKDEANRGSPCSCENGIKDSFYCF